MTSRTNPNANTHQPKLSPEEGMKQILVNAAEYDILSADDKKEFLKLIYKNNGVPSHLRADLWMLSTGALKAMKSNPDYYWVRGEDQHSTFRGFGQEVGACQECRNEECEWDRGDRILRRPLLEAYPDMPDPNQEQIQLDLHRTFVDDPEFTENSGIHEKMARILGAYTKRNSTIGYWQGMNCLTGMILRVIDDEEEAFWLFSMLIETILPLDYYSLMLEVIIDQKVLMHLLHKKKPKFLRKYFDVEVELIMRSFQWFICLFCLNFKKEIVMAIWDFLFLEGDIALFKSAFTLFALCLPVSTEVEDLTSSHAFMKNDSEKLTVESFVKTYQKYSDFSAKEIKDLRRKFRKSTIWEQREIHLPNLNTSMMDDTDTILFRRVKLLGKFFVLNKAIRNLRARSLMNLSREELSLDWEIKCNPKNPLCLYDFTGRSKILHFLVYRVNKAWRIIPNYFGEDEDKLVDGGMKKVKSIFGVLTNVEVTPSEDTTTFIRTLRKSTISILIAYEAGLNKEIAFCDPCDYDNLLLTRNMHLCSYKGFEDQFQKLFNEDSALLFQNPSIYNTFVNEKSCIELTESLVYEILSCVQFEKSIEKAKELELAMSGQRRRRQPAQNSFSRKSRKSSADCDIEFVLEPLGSLPNLCFSPKVSDVGSDNLGNAQRRFLQNCWKFR